MTRSNGALARGACVLWIGAFVFGCAKEKGVPYAPMGVDHDAGRQSADSGVEPADGGAQLPPTLPNSATQKQLEQLQEWGADIEDPDKICTGWNHSCAIDKDAKVWCWGSGAQSMPPNDLPPAVQVACGIAHTCALDEDGKITCWGAGTDPAMFDNSNLGQSAVPDGVYKEVAAGAGGAHTCAIDIKDRIVCWGAGGPGHTDETKAFFGQALAPEGKYKSITAGEAHSCAVDLATEEAVCWGGSGDGTCFPPNSYDCGQSSPPFGGFESVSAGSFHTCGVRLDGSVTCWGRGTGAEACDPGAGSDAFECGQAMPPAPDGEEAYARVRAGTLHTCGITKKHKVRCWGWNLFGQTDAPTTPYAQAAAGDGHSCGIATDGTISCWGSPGDPKTHVPEGFPRP